MAAKKRSRPIHARRSISSGFRVPRVPIYLCVEGATERAYIEALLEFRYTGTFVPRFLGGSGRRSNPHSSLKNLIELARREENRWNRRTKSSSCIWIVCDADQNAVHQDMLEHWISQAPLNHRVAIQSASIEAWFLQHFDNPSRPTTNEAALGALKAKWKTYSKGCEIPKWLIDRTDEALHREKQFVTNRDSTTLFPAAGSSQIPSLIEYLDQIAAKHPNHQQ